MTIRRACSRLVALVRKRQLERELEDEILAHLELAERDGIAAGLSPEEARLAARRRFGGVEQVKEEHRDRRGLPWIETLVRDIRYGVVSLGRDRAFTAVITGVLALGIGANVAMFSIVDAVLLKPLPFAGPDRIVRVWEAPRPGVTNSTSTPDFLDWKRLGSAFEALAAELPISAALTGADEPVRLLGKAVTAEYFRVFAAGVQLGRTFVAQDERLPTTAIVLSDAAWREYFGGDPDVLRRTVMLDGEPHEVFGILQPGAFDRDPARFWKLLVFTPDQHIRGSHWLTVHGRLKQGVTLAQARHQMEAIDAALEEVTPVWKRDWKIVVEPLDRLLVGDNLRRSMLVAFGAVALVLLIACANVANLLLAKGAARRKEMAIRTALGASRGRLAAQLLTETLVLCVAGGAAGLALASFLIEGATPLFAQSIPYTADVTLDFRVFAFAALVALGVAVLTGMLPAIQTSSGKPGDSLRDASRGSSRGRDRIRRTIVIGEVALSLVLVCGAFLLFRSLYNLQQLQTGVRIENVITMSVSLPVQAYPTPERAALFYAAAAERLKSIPGVVQAALSTHLPLRWIPNGEAIEVPGVEGLVNVRFKRVDPSYFDALGIPVLAGRGITDGDGRGSKRVVVINEALARRLTEVAGMKDPVGRVIGLHCPRYVHRGTTKEKVEIAGIIRSERVAGPGVPDPSVVYVPLVQVPNPEVKLIVRAEGDPTSVLSGIREAVRQVDANLPIGDIATMQEVRERTLTGASRPAWLIGVFAAVAALLSALGLYGVLSYAVTQRRREIGIRMALGARSADVVGQVLRNALRMIVAGLAFGLAGAFAMTRVLQSLLFGVSPLDPAALAAACIAMTTIGAIAGLVPATRAARLDPMTTLREEG